VKKTACILTIITGLVLASCTKGGEPVHNDSPYTARQQAYLLNLARATLISYLKNKSKPEVDVSALPDELKVKRGCFVTLTKRGYGLRGCIGYILPVEPLYEGIINRAIAAATQDPRFPRVSLKELDDIQIEISILTLPEEITFSSPEELLDKLEPGRDGVVLKTPYGSSTYLPQVWEQLPDKELFLSSLCAKHGAPQNTWKQSGTISVSTYQAIVFHEPEFGRKGTGTLGGIAGPHGAAIIGSANWQKGEITEKTVQPGEEIEPLTICTPNSDIALK